jgi:hypothetical protein
VKHLLLAAASAALLLACGRPVNAQYQPPCYDPHGRPVACGYGQGYAPLYPYPYTAPPPGYVVPWGGVVPFFIPRQSEHENFGHENGRR